MAIKKIYDLSVDLKRTSVRVNVPVLVQGDSAEFRIRLLDNGAELSTAQLTGITAVKMQSGYDAQTVIQTVGALEGSVAVFRLRKGELFRSGTVQAMVQLEDADDRISTLRFQYQVIPDLEGNYVPGEQDVTIFQRYISDAQKKIDDINAAAEELAATDVAQLTVKLAETTPLARIANKSRIVINPLGNVALTQAPNTIMEIDKNGVIYAQRLENGATSVVKSLNNGLSWQNVHDFVIGKPSNIKALDNGELVVAINRNLESGSKTKVFVSSNNQTTWTMKFELGTLGCEITQQWGMEVHENIILVSEYGTHGEAVRVYLSKDMGQTFNQILNVATYTSNLPNTHVHGSFFDKYWNRIWVIWGDGGYYRPIGRQMGLLYSDDFGATWNHVDIPRQLLHGYAFEDRVVFLGDSVPNGMWVFKRGKKEDAPKLEFIYRFDDVQRIHYVPSGQAYRRDENSPLLIPVTFANGDSTNFSGTKFLLATYDGINFQEIWRDNVNHTSTMLFNVYGPTNDGKIIGQYIGDGRFWMTRIKGDLTTSQRLDVIPLSADENSNTIDARELGIRGDGFDESADMASAIKYCAENKKTLHIPRKLNIMVRSLKLVNVTGIKIVWEGHIQEFKESAGMLTAPIMFEKCNDLDISFDCTVTRRASNTDSPLLTVFDSKGLKLNGKLKTDYATPAEQLGTAIELKKVEDFSVQLKLEGFEWGYRLGNNDVIKNGEIKGEVIGCYRAPFRLYLLENVSLKDLKLRNNGIVGNQPNILGFSNTVLTNVLFNNIYFGKGNIGANVMLDSVSSAVNTVFENCDFSEFTVGNIGTRIRKSAGITTRNNKGINWQTGLTAAPTYTHWSVGEEIELTPAAGGYRSLVCVTAGSQGTWKGVGLIQA